MKRVLQDPTIKSFNRFRPLLLRGAIISFILSLLIAICLSIFGSFGDRSVLWGLFCTLFILSPVMLVSVNNLKCLESEDGLVQISALFGLVMNLLWGILWILIFWGIVDLYTYHDVQTLLPADCASALESDCANAVRAGYSLAGKLAYLFTFLAVLGLAVSNVLSIKEYNRRALILPLKVIAFICLAIVEIALILFIFRDSFSDAAAIDSFLEGFNLPTIIAIVVGFISALAALIISFLSRNNQRPNITRIKTKN